MRHHRPRVGVRARRSRRGPRWRCAARMPRAARVRRRRRRALELGGRDAALGADDEREVAAVGLGASVSAARRVGSSSSIRRPSSARSASRRRDGRHGRQPRPDRLLHRLAHDRRPALPALLGLRALPARDRAARRPTARSRRRPSSVAACTASSSRSPFASACTSVMRGRRRLLDDDLVGLERELAGSGRRDDPEHDGAAAVADRDALPARTR